MAVNRGLSMFIGFIREAAFPMPLKIVIEGLL